MIMPCFFCCENFKSNTIKYNYDVVNIQNKTLHESSVFFLNVINTIYEDNERII